MSEAGVVTVEWGDCDETGIVFYPNYFCWFDCGFQRLLRGRRFQSTNFAGKVRSRNAFT